MVYQIFDWQIVLNRQNLKILRPNFYALRILWTVIFRYTIYRWFACVWLAKLIIIYHFVAFVWTGKWATTTNQKINRINLANSQKWLRAFFIRIAMRVCVCEFHSAYYMAIICSVFAHRESTQAHASMWAERPKYGKLVNLLVLLLFLVGMHLKTERTKKKHGHYNNFLRRNTYHLMCNHVHD